MNLYDQAVNNRMKIIIISEDKNYINYVYKLFEHNPMVMVKEIEKTMDAISLMDDGNIYPLFIVKTIIPKGKEEIQDYLMMHEGTYSGILVYQDYSKTIVNRLNKKTANFLESHFYYFKGKNVIEMLRPKFNFHNIIP